MRLRTFLTVKTMLHRTSLIVDDEPSVRGYIITVLQGDGFQTIEAENGVHALELLNKHDGAVDLLVSDIKMPVMDGITLAWSVLVEFPSIPVILVSGYADIAQAKLPHTGFEFVQIPFHPATLLSAAKRVMGPKNSTSRPSECEGI